jgi:hypothetical protein
MNHVVLVLLYTEVCEQKVGEIYGSALKQRQVLQQIKADKKHLNNSIHLASRNTAFLVAYKRVSRLCGPPFPLEFWLDIT